MTETKEILLRKYVQGTFASFPTEKDETMEKERKGIREGTKGISCAKMIDISRIKPDFNQLRKSLDHVVDTHG